MKISWIELLRSIPGAKRAVDGVVAPGASASATVWYNLLKALFTVLAATGLYVGLPDADLQTMGALLALAIPAVFSVLDMVANLWLRIRTTESLAAKGAEQEHKDIVDEKQAVVEAHVDIDAKYAELQAKKETDNAAH